MADDKDTNAGSPSLPPGLSGPTDIPQGDPSKMEDSQFVRYFEELTGNIMSMRRDALRTLLDPRRDLDAECGYPKWISPEQYQLMYDRDPIAKRVCEYMEKEIWQVYPDVYEVEDSDVTTPFETDWDRLSKMPLRGEPSWYQDQSGCVLFEYFKRASILARVHHYSVILCGYDDGRALSEPVEGVIEQYSAETRINRDKEGKVVNTVTDSVDGVYSIVTNATYPSTPSKNGTPPSSSAPPSQPTKPKRNLLFLRVFPETQAVISRVEANPSSPRFGQPTMYSITFNDPREQVEVQGLSSATYDVHWTRVVHIVGSLSSSEVFSVPEMKAPYNRLMDLQKLYGGSAEMFWKGAFFGVSLESNPQLGPNPVLDLTKTRNQMEQYFNGLQRYLAIVGMNAKVLAPAVASPKDQIEIQLEAICIEKGCPVKIFKGSERGQLASSQDYAEWNEVVRGEQIGHATQRVVCPFVDRMIMVGVVTTPTGYSCDWPKITSQSATEMADIALKFTQALALFTTSGAEASMSLKDYYFYVWHLTEEEAEAIVENALEASMESEERDIEHQKTLIDEGIVPDPTEPKIVAVPGGGGKGANGKPTGAPVAQGGKK